MTQAVTQHDITRTTPYTDLPQWLTVEETASCSGKSARGRSTHTCIRG
jgi:hypothetical protein